MLLARCSCGVTAVRGIDVEPIGARQYLRRREEARTWVRAAALAFILLHVVNFVFLVLLVVGVWMDLSMLPTRLRREH